MSLWADYLREKTSDHIVETSRGFVTYRYIEEDKTVYIVDIYVVPEYRQTKEASQMADSICAEAKKRGCVKLLGSVIPSNKNSTSSLKVLLGYGMTLDSCSTDFILFRKDL